jgi:GT2 family glycosyltransferase
VLFFKELYDIMIVVVDNSKDQDDFLELTKYIQNNQINNQVKIVKINNNGYFDALNIGIDYIDKIQYRPEYYIIGNNDITFENDFLKILKELKIENDELVIAPDVITNEKSHENPHVIDRVSIVRKLKYDLYYCHYFVAKLITKFYSTDRKLKKFDSQRKHIHMGIGALYILTPNFFIHFNKLWNEVFLYGEEAILAGQMMSVKGKILYEPNLKCFHNESTTTSKLPAKEKYLIIKSSYKKYRKYL